MKEIVNLGVGSFLTTILYLLGGFDYALQTLLIMIVLDYVTGICKAIYLKQLSSQIGAKGIVKKIGYLVIVAVAVIIDNIVGQTGAIRTQVPPKTVEGLIALTEI